MHDRSTQALARVHARALDPCSSFQISSMSIRTSDFSKTIRARHTGHTRTTRRLISSACFASAIHRNRYWELSSARGSHEAHGLTGYRNDERMFQFRTPSPLIPLPIRWGEGYQMHYDYDWDYELLSAHRLRLRLRLPCNTAKLMKKCRTSKNPHPSPLPSDGRG
jgi:hypothetical protein